MSSNSSNKRRKVEQPQAAANAMSAVAARRQLNASADSSTSSVSSETRERHSLSSSNAFSALRNLRSKEISHSSLSKSKPTEQQGHTEDDRRQATPNRRLGSSSISAPASPGKAFEERKVTQYSSFRLSAGNHRVRPGNILELKLSSGERFLVHGTYGVRLRSGEVTVLGAVLRPAETIHWVQAPQCSAVPVIRTSEDSHIELHPDLSTAGLRALSRLSPLFRGIWNESSGKDDTYKILYTSDDIPRRSPVQELASLPAWNKKLASLASTSSSGSPLTTLVCGPKSAGKSTFSKLLGNRLLTKSSPSNGNRGVMLLDLDPGQPEFTPSGMLSLVLLTSPNFGTPLTHPTMPRACGSSIKCHSLASVTPQTAPNLYLEAAMDLYQTYLQTYQEYHLLINTPGWILGTGLDLLVSMIGKIGPKEVVYMSEDGPSEAVEALSDVTTGTFTILPSQQAELSARTAAQLRAMQMMSYFHHEAEMTSREKANLAWNPSPLSNISPWRVQYSGPHTGILGIMTYDTQSSPSMLAELINGTIVAVVEIEDAKAFRSMDESISCGSTSQSDPDTKLLESLISKTPEGLPYVANPDDIALDPRYSSTIGLALIRGIDTRAQSLQLLSPLSEVSLRRVKEQRRFLVLVHGKFDPPTWAYTEDLYERSDAVEQMEDAVEIADANAGDDSMAFSARPWVEVLSGNDKRPVGSKVWRVRRDLGRTSNKD